MNQFPIYFLLASSFLLMAISTQNGANAAPSASFLKLFGKKSNGPNLCEKCKEEIADMDNTIQQTGTFVESYLLEVLCPMMAPHEKECQDFVNNNLAQVFAQIHEALSNPEKVCQEAGKCPKNEGQTKDASKLVLMAKLVNAMAKKHFGEQLDFAKQK